MSRYLALAALLCLAGLAQATRTAPPVGVSGEDARKPAGSGLVELLPPALRAEGAGLLRARDPTDRSKRAKKLAEDEAARAAPFLLGLLGEEESPVVRQAIVSGLALSREPGVPAALERTAASDPDADVSLLALDALRQRAVSGLRPLLASRLELAHRARDEAAVRAFEEEDERWIALTRGSMLPSFLRDPPAPFEVVPAGRPIRVVAFGDFGDDSTSQKSTARAIRDEARRKPFDFGLILGDNFYEQGSRSPRDPRWKSGWEDLYGPLHIRFYAVLGNHDWRLPDSPAAEILYSARSRSWDMPAPYYNFRAGAVEFFAIDTNEVREKQLAWLKAELEKSSARWKVVYGHHPVYSAGSHGDSSVLIETLLPVLRRRANIYLCGHDHDMQHLKADGGVHFFVAGAGGAHQRPIHGHERTLFAKTDLHGFAVLEADAGSLTVRFVAEDGSELYSHTLRAGRGESD